MKQELRDIFVKDMTMKGGDETKDVFVIDLDSRHTEKREEDGEGLSALLDRIGLVGV